MSNIIANYQLKHIELTNLFIEQRPTDFQGKEFQFNIKAQARVNGEKKIIFIVVSIETTEVNNNKILAAIETAVGFEISNFEEVAKLVGDNLYEIDLELEIHLRSISVSTTRGVMWSHFKGTYLNGAILPAIPKVMSPDEEEKLKTQQKKVN